MGRHVPVPDPWLPRGSRTVSPWHSKAVGTLDMKAPRLVPKWCSRWPLRSPASSPPRRHGRSVAVPSALSVAPPPQVKSVATHHIMPVRKALLKKAGIQRAKTAALRARHVDFWGSVVQALGCDSALAGRDARHIRAPFTCLAPSTLARHKAGWKQWARHCIETGARPGSYDPIGLADFCALLAPEDPECEAGACSGAAAVRSCLAALRFVAHKADAQGIARAVADPSVAGYEKLCGLTSERREAPPFCLYAVAELEALFYAANVPLGYLLLAGFQLACIWGSLRFSDGACTSPASLSLQGWALRGSAWRTKVCKRGTPFGVIGIGLFGAFPAWGWAHKWLCALNRWVASLPESHRGAIDFLLPHFSKDGHVVSGSPCSYAVAVLRLRSLLAGLGVPNPMSYTAHSAKATVLSWGRQLDLADQDLAKQGHHKTTLGHCAGLYGRDDVFQALKVQALVLAKVREGWRPLTAQRRGAEQPLHEPALRLELTPVHHREFEPHFRSQFVPLLPEEATRVLGATNTRPLVGGQGMQCESPDVTPPQPNNQQCTSGSSSPASPRSQGNSTVPHEARSPYYGSSIPCPPPAL